MTAKASGVDLSANTPADVGQAGASGGTYSLHMLNRGDVRATIQLGISSTSATFENARKLEQAFYLSGKESSTYGPIVMAANEYLVAQSDADDVNGLMMGHDD